MAKIKRFVTSGLEGRTLSDRYDDHSFIYNDEGLVQYYAENNEMSAVLKPGAFYGAGNDSGDAQGLNTIKLIPNYDSGTDQYIIIDPTTPNHVHIRAGGTIDASNAELILGGENTHVKVTDSGSTVVINANDISINSQASPSSLNINTYSGAVVNSARTAPYSEENKVVATLGDIEAPLASPTAWVPSLTGTGFAQSSNPATGNYYKIGNMVFVSLYIPFTNVTNFGTGQYSVNLPLNAARHTDIFGGSIHNTGSPTTFYSIKGHLEPNSNSMSLWYISSTALDQPITHAAPITLNVTDLIHMSFVYEAASA